MLIKEMLEKEYVSKELSSPMGVVHITKERNIYNAVRNESSIAFQKSIVHSIDKIKKDLISIERYDLDYDTIYEFATLKLPSQDVLADLSI